MHPVTLPSVSFSTVSWSCDVLRDSLEKQGPVGLALAADFRDLGSTPARDLGDAEQEASLSCASTILPSPLSVYIVTSPDRGFLSPCLCTAPCVIGSDLGGKSRHFASSNTRNNTPIMEGKHPGLIMNFATVVLGSA